MSLWPLPPPTHPPPLHPPHLRSSLQESSMELDLLLGERLKPPSAAALQHRALLQLLQPGTGADRAHTRRSWRPA